MISYVHVINGRKIIFNLSIIYCYSHFTRRCHEGKFKSESSGFEVKMFYLVQFCRHLEFPSLVSITENCKDCWENS